MSPTHHEIMTETLEQYVDSNELAAVVLALAAVCHAKAEHVGSNWQDKQLAHEWGQVGLKLDRLAEGLAQMSVPGISGRGRT